MKKRDVKILLVDDDTDILEIVGYNLSQEGYQIITAFNGKEAIDKARKELPHLIIMDVMMPEMDGMEACGIIRSIPELSNVVIALFTARSEDYSQVAGFNAGADDYILKTIKPKLLISKVNAWMRRLEIEQNESSKPFNIGGMEINRDEYKVVIAEREIFLPKKEFDLLFLFASKPGQVFTREDIMEKVWNNVTVGSRTIDVHVSKLREKIGDDVFKTIKGVGYKLEC